VRVTDYGQEAREYLMMVIDGFTLKAVIDTPFKLKVVKSGDMKCDTDSV